MCIPKKSKKSDQCSSHSTKEPNQKKSNEVVKDINNNETPPPQSKEKSKESAEKVVEAPAESFKTRRSVKDKKTQQTSKAVVQAWVQRALDKGVGELQDEFRALSKWKAESMTLEAFTANKDKNRYLDVPCGDNRRVILKWPGLECDYIHANYVSTPNAENRFICTQGPLENTQYAFWAMTLQEQVEVIIMLCNTIECGKLKCMQYFPREKDEKLSFGEGDGVISIENIEVRKMSAEDPYIRVCKLKTTWKEGGAEKSRVVTHYQWENWPDRGVPPTKLTAAALLTEVRGSTKPILVHCSAGIGRTGTIVAIAYVQERMQNAQCCLSMDELLKELRSQRPYSIQNEFQYIYLHRVLLAYFLEKHKSRFLSSLEGPNADKYAKWCEDYKAATGCD